MNRRSELRFQVYTSVKVAHFDEPERESEAQLVDVSPSGVRILADSEFHEDDIVTIETDQHLILADVRYCRPRGVRSNIGAERVHAVAKFLLPRTASRVERNEVLVADYRRRLQDELEKPAIPGVARETGAAARFGFPPAEEAHRASQRTARAGRTSWGAAAVVFMILSGLAGAGTYFFRTGLSGAAASDSVQATISSPVVVQSILPKAEEGAFGAATPAGASSSRLAIAVTRRSWVAACVDGKLAFARIFDPGSGDTLEFAQQVILRAADGGAVEVQRDGKGVGTLGEKDQVRVVEFTPDASRVLAGNEAGDCTQTP